MFSLGLMGLAYLLNLHLPGLGGEKIARAIRVMPRLAETLQEESDLVLIKPALLGKMWARGCRTPFYFTLLLGWEDWYFGKMTMKGGYGINYS